MAEGATDSTLAARAPSGNGSSPDAAMSATDVIDLIRRRRRNVLLLRGFGPLAVAVVLLALMLLLAPSIAPERIVEQPVNEPQEQTSTTAPATTAASTTVHQ